MRLFIKEDPGEFLKIVKFIASGGQALHVYKTRSDPKKTKRCYRGKENWGFILDQNNRRLRVTAKRLGVKRIVIRGEGEEFQHLAIFGNQLKKAINETRKGMD